MSTEPRVISENCKVWPADKGTPDSSGLEMPPVVGLGRAGRGMGKVLARLQVPLPAKVAVPLNAQYLERHRYSPEIVTTLKSKGFS